MYNTFSRAKTTDEGYAYICPDLLQDGNAVTYLHVATLSALYPGI